LLTREQRWEEVTSEVTGHTFVLNHGAFHDGTAWTQVATALRRRGHDPHIPIAMNESQIGGKRNGHLQTAQQVATYIDERNLTDVVLVGHSAGGVTVCKVVELIPERIRRLVFCSAFVLADGECLADNMPPQSRQLLSDLANGSPDQTILPPFALWREIFMNDADFDLARSTHQQLVPMYYRFFLEAVDLKMFYSISTPRSYILSTEDTALPQDQWGWHPRMTSRLGLHRFLQMPGSHEVMFSNPYGMADTIIEAGRD
jgi:pimeloyl-ACP methyl ester carboxylesterase